MNYFCSIYHTNGSGGRNIFYYFRYFRNDGRTTVRGNMQASTTRRPRRKTVRRRRWRRRRHKNRTVKRSPPGSGTREHRCDNSAGRKRTKRDRRPSGPETKDFRHIVRFGRAESLVRIQISVEKPSARRPDRGVFSDGHSGLRCGRRSESPGGEQPRPPTDDGFEIAHGPVGFSTSNQNGRRLSEQRAEVFIEKQQPEL